jgi:hypothetical protein
MEINSFELTNKKNLHQGKEYIIEHAVICYIRLDVGKINLHTIKSICNL